MTEKPYRASEDLENLLKDFYNLTGMKICIYDGDGKELCYYPERYSPFCKYLRSFPDAEEKCRRCDLNALAECKKTQSAYLYPCHAGLTECMAPVRLNDSIRGFIGIGQIREKSSRFPETDYGADRETAKKYWESLPEIPHDKILSAIHILEACTGYDQLKRFVREQNETLGSRLEAFIAEHIRGDLGVNRLCRKFLLSRRELYAFVRENYRCTPAEFVRLRRLRYAAELLKTTDLAVSEIAERCGIGDYNYFSKMFRRAYGMSARDFRK